MYEKVCIYNSYAKTDKHTYRSSSFVSSQMSIDEFDCSLIVLLSSHASDDVNRCSARGDGIGEIVVVEKQARRTHAVGNAGPNRTEKHTHKHNMYIKRHVGDFSS